MNESADQRTPLDLDLLRAYLGAAVTGCHATEPGTVAPGFLRCTPLYSSRAFKGCGMAEPLEDIKGVLLDLDGTIFVGDRLVPGAADAVDALRRGGLPLISAYCASKAAVISITQSAALAFLQNTASWSIASVPALSIPHWADTRFRQLNLTVSPAKPARCRSR